MLATKEALNAEISRAENKENEIVKNLSDEIARAKSSENVLSSDINNEVNRATTAEMSINDNLSLLISELTTRLNALADSDDTTLDQLSEIVAYIKSNRTLIENVTTNKANASDFSEHRDDMTVHTNSTERANFTDAYNKRHTHSNKSILDEITSILIESWNAAKTHADSTHARTDATKVEKSTTNGNILINDIETNVYTHPSGTNPHGTTKSDVGLGNVENKSSADIRSELTKEDVTTALGYTPSNTQTTQMLTGVKGNAEGSYRTGNVNLTPANIGAVAKSGDTLTGQLQKDGISTSWVTGRDVAMLRQKSLNGYSPMLSMKSTNGSWELGIYTNNIVHLSYITDTDYNAKTNKQTVDYQFKPDGTIIAPTFSGKLNGNANNGITYSDSQPTSLTKDMTWIGK